MVALLTGSALVPHRPTWRVLADLDLPLPGQCGPHATATSSTTRYARTNLLMTNAYMTTANSMLT
jgi:hypothetical protein